MLNFVKKIIDSEFASGIYAWTSMFDLCVVQTKVTYPYDGPFLKVSPNFDGTVDLSYLDTLIQKKKMVQKS